jgi:hypothetical protein
MSPTNRVNVPWGVHALTVIHGLGAIACLIMAIGSAASEQFRLGLVASPGSAIMVEFFGEHVWMFLVVIATLLTTLCYGSWRLRSWTLPLTIVCYSIGVIGGLWEVSIGIPAGLLAATINGCVVAYACSRRVRLTYGWR